MRSRGSVRGTVFSVVWALALGGGILAHRAGLLPSWVYHGRLRDEVKRRTGFDLADRSAPKPILQVTGFRGSGGMHPTLAFDVRNATDTTLRYLEMWARFNLATKPAGHTPYTVVAGGDSAPLAPGQTRHVVLRVETAQGLGLTTRGPLLTANLYWAFHSTSTPWRRANQAPDVALIPVRNP